MAPDLGDLGDLSDTLLAAMDSAAIGMMVTVEQEGRFERVYVSNAAARIFGLSAEEAMSAGPLAVLRPEEQIRLAELKERRRAGEDEGRVLRLLVGTPGGRRVPVEVSITVAMHQGTRAFVTFIRDVSEHITMEEHLRTSEARFRTFTEAAPDAIFVIHDARLLYMNPVAKRILGSPPPGTSLEQLVHEDDVPVMKERLKRMVAGEVLRPYEYRFRQENDETVSVEISSIPFEYEGRPCVLAFGRDITERKRMQGRLIQADRMATMGTLATGVAHEINNPLTYVVLHLEKLRRSLPKLVPDANGRKDAEHMIAEALDGAERVRVIVQDLLSLARSDTSTHGPTNVRRVVGTSLKLASPVLDACATVETELLETAPVRANSAWLGQVFVNLLVNAGQAFTEKAPKKNRVRVATRTLEDGRIEIRIEDNGPGIPSEIRNRIFDPFFTTKEAGVGTGLGLAISNSIIDSLGGEIDVESRTGVGTTFRIRLPPLSQSGRATKSGRSIRASIEKGLRTGEFPVAGSKSKEEA